MRIHWLSAAALPVVVTALTLAPSAAAQEVRTVEESAGPNMALVNSGAIMLGGAWAASYIVASSSPRAVDERLYIPVAGPWLDLANRGECAGCSGEAMNKALLIGDGVLQAAGVLQIVGAFVFPEKRVVRVGAAEMTVSPASLGRGAVGLTASGTF